MTPPMNMPVAVVQVPSQHVSKVDKSDRRKLQLSADSYVHGNEETDTSLQTTVYNRRGQAGHLKTRR